MKEITPQKYETLTSDKLAVSNACEKLPLATVLEKKGILSIVEIDWLIDHILVTDREFTDYLISKGVTQA